MTKQETLRRLDDILKVTDDDWDVIKAAIHEERDYPLPEIGVAAVNAWAAVVRGRLLTLLESAAGGGIPGPMEATLHDCMVFREAEAGATYEWTKAGLSAVFAARLKRYGVQPSGPSREWLAKAGDTEDAARSVSVGGLAADLGMLAGDKTTEPEAGS